MKKLLVFSILLSSQVHAQTYSTIHRRAIVVDTHNDILMKAVDQGIAIDADLSTKAHSDLTRWRTGGLDVQLFSVYCDGDIKNPYAFANRLMDTLDAVAGRNPQLIIRVANTKELRKAAKHQKMAAMFGVEGGHMIENDLNKLEALYNRGARYLTLTHNIAPPWASSAADETTKPNMPHKGLTDFGRQVVQRMNQLGMLIDVSHAGDQTFWDVIKLTTKPIIASHSSVYSLVPHRRNLTDHQIKAIAKNGGVIQVNFNPGFIDSSFDKKEAAFLLKHAAENDSLKRSGVESFYALNILYDKYRVEAEAIRPPLALLIGHIEYIIELVGIDYVGLGSDFDGINLTPQHLDDVTTYPVITKALHAKGYSKKDITKILGGNFLRVLKANEKQ